MANEKFVLHTGVFEDPTPNGLINFRLAMELINLAGCVELTEDERTWKLGLDEERVEALQRAIARQKAEGHRLSEGRNSGA